MTKNELDIDRILQILPHRWPFVMVDRVTEVVPNELIRGHKSVSFNEPWFLGLYVWKWFPEPDRVRGESLEFSPQGRPAEQVLVRRFRGSVPEP